MNLLPSIKVFLILMLGELCSSVHKEEKKIKIKIKLSSSVAVNNVFILDRPLSLCAELK